MLTQLSTVKARLNIIDTKDDVLLNLAINGISELFESVCNRRFGRNPQAVEEFDADETEIRVRCYPVESVSLFELKDNENQGWQPLEPMPDHVIRRGSVVSMHQRLGQWRQRSRITYCGGYVLPGEPSVPGQTPLPADIQHACVEQVASWYLNRNNVGMLSVTDPTEENIKFAQEDLLPAVKSVLKRHCRWLA